MVPSKYKRDDRVTAAVPFFVKLWRPVDTKIAPNGICQSVQLGLSFGRFSCRSRSTAVNTAEVFKHGRQMFDAFDLEYGSLNFSRSHAHERRYATHR
jgi:hypothetical protein